MQVVALARWPRKLPSLRVQLLALKHPMNVRAVLPQTCTAAATMAGGLMRSSALNASPLSFWRGEGSSTCQSRQGSPHTDLLLVLACLTVFHKVRACLQEAAKTLQVCENTLKRVCREVDIGSWPYRSRQKDQRLLQQIAKLEAEPDMVIVLDLLVSCQETDLLAGATIEPAGKCLSSTSSVLCAGPVSGSRLCERSVTWPAFPD